VKMWLSGVLAHVPVYVSLACVFVSAFSHFLCSMYLGEVLRLVRVCGGCETSEDRETVSQPPHPT
jgi:hypothetical protein